MKLSEWANLAEISSAIAVVFSLVYVGFQINENTSVAKATVHQEMINYVREQSELLLTNDALAGTVWKGEVDISSLSSRERSQFYEFTTQRMAIWELAFLNYKTGLVDEDNWKGWDGYHRALTTGKPGYKEFWRDNRASYNAEFMSHIDSLE